MALKNKKKVQKKSEKSFLQGNEVIVRAALDAGADMFAGYPITPITEILTGWSKEAAKNNKIKFTQTEDETSAGFTTIGGVLAGKRAWTATAGPGNVLMQDPMSMAEAMRLPVVCYIGQRGGPSTGTVIYSQQEVTLTRMGGNGEGLRIVYSPSSVQELYDYMVKAFDVAWKYRFPTFVLGDGYMGKTMRSVNVGKKVKVTDTESYVLNNRNKESQNLRNCYSLEEEIYEDLSKNIEDFGRISSEVSEHEDFFTKDADLVIFAHGAVGEAARVAVEFLREEGIKVGLFRPITLRPFPVEAAKKAVFRAKRILIAESSFGHFGRIVREVLYGACDLPAYKFYRPAMGITTEDIIEKVRKIKR